MTLHLSRRAAIGSALLLITCSAPLSLRAQTDNQNDLSAALKGEPILVIQREFTKPGRDGSSHEATEAAFMRAAAANKAPFHYIALTSLSGPNRALFFSGYSSMAAVEQERKSMSAALNTALDKAMVADGDVLSGADSSVWRVDSDLSTNTRGMRIGARYLIVREFVIKPGHVSEWEQAVKLVMDGYKKADIGAHWVTYRMMYGNSSGPTYLVLTSVKSMDEVDAMHTNDPKFVQAMGEDGLKHLEEVEASCVTSEKSNMFLVNPKMSIPSDEMIKAEPAFWRPKATSSSSGVAKKSAAAKNTTTGQ
ncbi:MAG TPA: hypothetical protein VLI45_09450 [Acidobacteriaceae bacterium]|nr:hypothetical protein [Acidobacteriaceae bacterium]